MREIKLYKSPFRALKLLLVSSIFVALGIVCLKTGNMPACIAWAGIFFFGLGISIGLFHLLDRRPQITINGTGIFDRTVHKDFINWEIIQDAYPIDIYGQKFICLVVDKQFKPSRAKGKLYRQTVKLNEAIGAQELNLSLGQIKIDVAKLTEFIIAMRTAGRSGRNDLRRSGAFITST